MFDKLVLRLKRWSLQYDIDQARYQCKHFEELALYWDYRLKELTYKLKELEKSAGNH